MTKSVRTIILRANALFLLIASTGGLVSDLRGAFLHQGPVGRILGEAPHAAIGFAEAHGLALIFSVLLWRAAPVRSWHLTAMAIHALLGTANLVFWQIFISADMLLTGYITTALHGMFVLLHAVAAGSVRLSPAGLQEEGA